MCLSNIYDTSSNRQTGVYESYLLNNALQNCCVYTCPPKLTNLGWGRLLSLAMGQNMVVGLKNLLLESVLRCIGVKVYLKAYCLPNS